MKLKQRIIRNLEWANKRLKLQGKKLDETQLEIIEFCLLHDLEQLTSTDVSQQRELLVDFLAKMEEKAKEYKHLVPSEKFIDEYLKDNTNKTK